jgi:hypothetical protein
LDPEACGEDTYWCQKVVVSGSMESRFGYRKASHMALVRRLEFCISTVEVFDETTDKVVLNDNRYEWPLHTARSVACFLRITGRSLWLKGKQILLEGQSTGHDIESRHSSRAQRNVVVETAPHFVFGCKLKDNRN